MARIRQVKPEFFDDADIGALTPLARLAFIGLWTQAESRGPPDHDERRLKVRLAEHDRVNFGSLVDELAAHRFVIPYEVDGCKFLQVRTFLKHQHPHIKEPASVLPPCPHSALVQIHHRASTGPALDEHRASTGLARVEPESSPPGSRSLVLNPEVRTGRLAVAPATEPTEEPGRLESRGCGRSRGGQFPEQR